ncbi:MAG: hypothetical protein PF488_04800 [Patescibacteria group bacterium]|jgi:hypothetical protein|nr:hypothetical protein [Patescibacteria group bacterium]
MIRCKWCGLLFLSDKEAEIHEENCDLNDGGLSDRNYEDIENKYFD